MVGRSRTGCLTCRTRKLKCDEHKPKCGQCQKASRECIPSTGLVFRHQQNASMSRTHEDADDNLQGFYAYRNTFDKNNVWVKTPKLVTFIVNAAPDYDPDRASASADPESEFTSREQSSLSSLEYEQNSARQPSYTSPKLESLAVDSGHSHFDYRLTLAGSPEAIDFGPVPPHLAEEDIGTLSPLGSRPHLPTSPTDLSHILNPIPPPLEPLDPYLERDPYRSDDFAHEMEVEADHETAFLLRHFTEVTAAWMDLFDLSSFFTYYVPVKALTNPLLKNAACAYAAKQLSRVQGRRPMMGGACTTQGPTEYFPHVTHQEWAYKGAQYYDRAIELLMGALRDGTMGMNRYSPEEDPRARAASIGSTGSATGEKRKLVHNHLPSEVFMSNLDHSKKRKVSQGRALSDEMAAATAMLCDYELQEAPGTGWLRHLDGTKSLLDIVETSMMPLHTRSIAPRRQISRARQATFWNFARQDMLSALINESPTRLDTEDLNMWRDAGLAITSDGFIEPSNMSATGLPEGGSMKEDMISNALIWIIAKLVNYAVAAETTEPHTHTHRGIWDARSPFNAPHPEQHESWENLHKHLAIWYAGLPDTFKPCAQLGSTDLRHRYNRARTFSSPGGWGSQRRPSVFPETWYNIPMCASTMQFYHMSRMLLLLNQPQHRPSPHTQHRASFSSNHSAHSMSSINLGKSTFFTRFGSFKSLTADVEHHARPICSIAVSRPDAAVRIHMVQPLYTAGQCLESTEERREVLRLLREIQHDTGWASDYRVERLLSIWG